jgi:hypothetical protein
VKDIRPEVNSPYDGGSGCDRLGEGCVRIFHCHHDPDSAASERFRAEIQMFRGFVSYPKVGACNGKLSYDSAGRIVNPVEFDSVERGLIKVDCLRAAPNR